MTPEERVLQSLRHKEPDRVPFDLGSTIITGINLWAYKNLLSYLGYEDRDVPVFYERSEIVQIHEDVLQRLKVDTRGIFPNIYKPAYWPRERKEDNEYFYIIDHWGVTWRKPKQDGHFYDIVGSPLKGNVTKEALEEYPWPDLSTDEKVGGLREQARKIKAHGDYALIVEDTVVEVFSTPFGLRSYEDFYVDLAADPSRACYLMDKTLEIQLQYWAKALEELSDFTLIVRTGDDLGHQFSLLISPEMYRQYVKPRHKKLFSSIRDMAKKEVFVFFHSDGSVYDLIPDLIEIGIDILNPVQYSAEKMDTRILKKEFGNDISFWGGGVDTQHVLPYGTPEDVKQEVKRRIEDLAPGGGFVFGPVHNIQYDAPPENVMAMWEALQEYGVY